MNKYLQEAMNEYEQKIENGEPFYMDASTLMDIEEVYEKAGRMYDAERLMRFAERLHPDNEDVLVVKAYREKDKGNWQQALKIIHSIANQESRNVQLFYAEKEVASGLLDEAEQRINDCLPASMTEESYDWYLDLGELFLDYGFQHRALKYLSQIPQKYQFAGRVNELMADAYFQLQEYDKSIDKANQLIDLDPYNATSWAQLADIQQKKQMYEESVQSSDYALAIDSNNIKAMGLKVFSLFALQRNEEAMKCCMEYMQKAPNDYTLRMYAGEKLCSFGNFHDSLKILREALRLCPIECPDRIRLITDISYTLICNEQFDEAEEMLISSCQLGNSICDILLQLGNTYLDLHFTQRAIKTFEKALFHPQANEQIIASVAQYLVQANCFKEAENLWYHIAKLPPSLGGSIINAYAAWGMYQLKNKDLLLANLKVAIPSFVGIVVQLFGTALQTYEISEIILKIEQEFK